MLPAGVDGATVTHVAQRHDATRQQIYVWRHELKQKGRLFPTADAERASEGPDFKDYLAPDGRDGFSPLREDERYDRRLEIESECAVTP